MTAAVPRPARPPRPAAPSGGGRFPPFRPARRLRSIRRAPSWGWLVVMLVAVMPGLALAQSRLVLTEGDGRTVAGGGVITYGVDGMQRVAFVVGTNSPIWPVDRKSAKIVVFAVDR